MIALFVCIFGGPLWRFYFGEGNTFHYTQGAIVVHFVDVGQGDCIIIQLPDGKVAVIDGGEEMYASRIANYLRTRVFRKSERIDWLINTHAHRDHMGSFVTLMEQFDVGVVYRPHNLSLSPLEPEDDNGEPLALAPQVLSVAYSDFISAAERSSAEVRFVESGISINDGQNYEIFFHTPTRDMIGRMNEDALEDYNQISPVITVRYGSTVFVLTGDAGSPVDASVQTEQWFIQTDTAKQIDFANLDVFLKVGHHGSDTGTREAFLSFIKPDAAVISYGSENSFGFPHSMMMNRLKNHVSDENIYETAKQGNIAVRVNGDGTHIFLGFDNPPDLTLLWVAVFALIILGSFVNLRINSTEFQTLDGSNRSWGSAESDSEPSDKEESEQKSDSEEEEASDKEEPSDKEETEQKSDSEVNDKEETNQKSDSGVNDKEEVEQKGDSSESKEEGDIKSAKF